MLGECVLIQCYSPLPLPVLFAVQFALLELIEYFLQTLPSSFPLSKLRNSKKPTSPLSHLLFTHQTTLSASDLALYDGDLEGAQAEIRRYEREGVRLFGVGGVASELVEWEWGGPGANKEVGRVKVNLESSSENRTILTSSGLVNTADAPANLRSRRVSCIVAIGHWMRRFDDSNSQYSRR